MVICEITFGYLGSDTLLFVCLLLLEMRLMSLGVRLMSLGVRLKQELGDEFGVDFAEFAEFLSCFFLCFRFIWRCV